MGKPPMPIVIRKLIKKFFKNQRPPPSMIAQKYTSSLFECWKMHGIDSQKCLQYQQLYDKGMEMDFKANQALQKQMKKYPELVMAEFMPIPDKMYYKGREGWNKNAVHIRGRPWRF